MCGILWSDFSLRKINRVIKKGPLSSSRVQSVTPIEKGSPGDGLIPFQ